MNIDFKDYAAASQACPMNCDERLLKRLRRNLAAFDPLPGDDNGAKKASVAITIVDAAHGTDIYGLQTYEEWNNGAALILTQRGSQLKNHSGQWALPGGRQDEGESPEETALRELAEEVGLNLPPDRVIGRLDDFTTRSGFVITPVVIWGGPVSALTPNPGEVEAIHRIPMAEFLRKDSPILQDIPESENPVLLMPVGSAWIAAPTAAMIYQFREVTILGRSTRVAHFEQPYFAWK